MSAAKVRGPAAIDAAIKREVSTFEPTRAALTRCRVCKCTEVLACYPPCAWEPREEDLCTSCAELIRKVREWLIGAHHASFAALRREAYKPLGPGSHRTGGKRG
jgi:hypothetical protein